MKLCLARLSWKLCLGNRVVWQVVLEEGVLEGVLAEAVLAAAVLDEAVLEEAVLKDLEEAVLDEAVLHEAVLQDCQNLSGCVLMGLGISCISAVSWKLHLRSSILESCVLEGCVLVCLGKHHEAPLKARGAQEAPGSPCQAQKHHGKGQVWAPGGQEARRRRVLKPIWAQAVRAPGGDLPKKVSKNRPFHPLGPSKPKIMKNPCQGKAEARKWPGRGGLLRVSAVFGHFPGRRMAVFQGNYSGFGGFWRSEFRSLFAI